MSGIMASRANVRNLRVRMLADIIGKMEAHQYKKRALYRPPSVARGEP